MKKGLSWIVVFALVLMGQVLIGAEARAEVVDLSGVWEGKLAVSGMELRIVFNVESTLAGYQATMDSPDQGAKGIPISAVKLTGDQVVFEVKLAGAAFEGTLSADGQTIDGLWKQGNAALPLKVEKQDGPVANNRPQEPQKPFPYQEVEVTYENEIDGITLAGTLTLPEGEGPHPVVLLITGSGPQDRDENLLGHKPFLLISDYLTRRGIAVLRVDDRGVGGSTGDITTSTSADFAKDVQAGVDFLKTRSEIDQDQIGLIGHSEGGMIAPMVATQSDDIAFLVLLAAPGIPIDELMLLQVADVAKSSGSTDEYLQEIMGYQKKLFHIVKDVKDDEEAATQLRVLMEELTNVMSEEDKTTVINAWGSMEKYIDGSLSMFMAPWYRYFLAFDPTPVLSQVECPVFALNGLKDVQVAAKPNLAGIEKALREAGNEDVTTKEYPGLNHLFQTADTGSPAEYGMIEETMAPVVLEDMAEWILQRVEI